MLAVLAISVGGWKAAFATGNAGQCAMHINQADFANPLPHPSGPMNPPNWTSYGGSCVGPCPPQGSGAAHCEEVSAGQVVVNGVTLYARDCACHSYTAGGQSWGWQTDDAVAMSSFSCRTLKLNTAIGTFAGSACETITCANPCDLAEDPNITQSEVEINDVTYASRSTSCRCP